MHLPAFKVSNSHYIKANCYSESFKQCLDNGSFKDIYYMIAAAIVDAVTKCCGVAFFFSFDSNAIPVFSIY